MQYGKVFPQSGSFGKAAGNQCRLAGSVLIGIDMILQTYTQTFVLNIIININRKEEENDTLRRTY